MEGLALEVEDLAVDLDSPAGSRRLLEGIRFALPRGAVVGLVGESGAGKSMLSLALVRLLPPAARVGAGRVRVGPHDLFALRPGALRSLRGRTLGLVPQEPMAALNPVLTIGKQIGEVLALHRGLRGGAASERSTALLGELGIAEPAQQLERYPWQLSQGMAQRVVMAMALAAEPSVLIADEPTASVGLAHSSQILAALERERLQRGMSLLLISHQLGLVREHADEVLVLAGGRLVERAPPAQLFAEPQHAATRALCDAERTLSGVRT